MDESVGESRIGCDRFCESVEAAVLFMMGLVNGEERVAKQGQCADDVGVTTSCMIFT